MRCTRILVPALAVAFSPGLAPAQDAIGPAHEVRVVERVDGTYGVIREVVEDPSPAEVLRVQIELARHGYDPGVRSGVLDRATRRALAAFQAARGLVVCSCLSYETVVALEIAPVVVAREDGRARYRSVFIDRSWGRYPVYGSTVYYGYDPFGVRIGHDPYGRGVDRRPHGTTRPGRPDPPDRTPGTRPAPPERKPPETRPAPPERPPAPRSGGRIRGADPVRGTRPDDARPTRPAPRTAPQDDDRPARTPAP